VVVPYTPSPLNITQGITSLFSGRQKSVPPELLFEEQRLQLEQRVNVVEQGLARLGVRTIALQSEDLVELFYHIYNPTDPTGAAPEFNN
jgi:hypothetical protein